MTDSEAVRRPTVLVRPLPIILGLLAGLGVAVLLQQFALTKLTLGLLIGGGFAGAVVIGIGLPTLMLHLMKVPQDPEDAESEPDVQEGS